MAFSWFVSFDKLQRVSHAAIVENKRLGEILAWIKEQQDRQPGRRGHGAQARRAALTWFAPSSYFCTC
jgi:hypothetical protein